MKLIPRILQLMAGRDGSLLAGVAKIIEEKGIHGRQPARRCAAAGAGEGVLSRRRLGAVGERTSRRRGQARSRSAVVDIAQGAVAVERRVVAVEDAAGTDALLDRVALMRRSGASRGTAACWSNA